MHGTREALRSRITTAAIVAAWGAALLATPLPAEAKDSTNTTSAIRGEGGRKIGSLERKPDGDTIVRGKGGRAEGYLDADRRGGHIVRDEHGRKTGYISPGR